MKRKKQKPYNTEVAYKAFVNQKKPVKISFTHYNQEFDAFYNKEFYTNSKENAILISKEIKSSNKAEPNSLQIHVYDFHIDDYIPVSSYSSFSILLNDFYKNIVNLKPLIIQRLIHNHNKPKCYKKDNDLYHIACGGFNHQGQDAYLGDGIYVTQSGNCYC